MKNASLERYKQKISGQSETEENPESGKKSDSSSLRTNKKGDSGKKGKRHSWKDEALELRKKVEKLENNQGEKLLTEALKGPFAIGSEAWKKYVTDQEHGLSKDQIEGNAAAWAAVIDYYMPDDSPEALLWIAAIMATSSTFGVSYMEYNLDTKRNKKQDARANTTTTADKGKSTETV